MYGLLQPGAAQSIPFAMQNDWSNAINDFSASGVLTSTTTASSTSAGSTTVYLTDASTFKASQGISIVGAGAAGVDHTTTIASVNTGSNYVVLNVATVTTVGSGAVVYHDDTVALFNQAADANTHYCYLGDGDFIITDTPGYDSILPMTKMGRTFVGVNHLANRVYRNEWGYGTGVKNSTIYVRNATKNAIHLGSSGTNLIGLHILKHSSITPTAGSAVVVGVQSNGSTVYESFSANYTRDHDIKECYIDSLWTGITAWQDFQLHVSRCSMDDLKQHGLHINRILPYGGDDFNDMAFGGVGGGSGTGAGAAIYVEKSDWNRFVNPHSNSCKYGFYQNLSTTSQGQQIVQSLVVDEVSAGGYGVYISGGTVQAYGSSITDGRIYNSLGTGAAYFGANSRRNIFKNNQLIGTTTVTDLGTGNVISDNPVN